MRPISRALLNVLNSETFNPVELLDVTLSGQDPAQSFHFTSAGQQITWGGNTYVPLNMTRGQVEERMATSGGEHPVVTMTASNVDTQMAKLLSMADLDGAWATLWVTDRELALAGRTRDAIQVTTGELRDVSLADEILVFSIENVLGQMEKLTIPRRIYSATCGYIFGEAACGVNIQTSPTTTTASAQGDGSIKWIATDDVTGSLGGADPNDFWQNGYIGATTGPAALQFRQIQRVAIVGSVSYFYLRGALLVPPNAGDTILIRRQCRKTKQDCIAYQGNALQFGGFSEVPPVRFKPIVTDHTWGG